MHNTARFIVLGRSVVTKRIEVRMRADLLAEVDDWRRLQDGTMPDVSEAIRRLIEAGLKATKPEG